MARRSPAKPDGSAVAQDDEAANLCSVLVGSTEVRFEVARVICSVTFSYSTRVKRG